MIPHLGPRAEAGATAAKQTMLLAFAAVLLSLAVVRFRRVVLAGG